MISECILCGSCRPKIRGVFVPGAEWLSRFDPDPAEEPVFIYLICDRCSGQDDYSSRVEAEIGRELDRISGDLVASKTSENPPVTRDSPC